MNRILLLVVFSVAVGACGSPEVPAPDSLEVVFLPLAGARDVPLDATPKVYFNDQVDSASVSATSVFMESATLNWNQAEGQGTCEGVWSAVTSQAGVDGSVVTLTPDADLLDTTCYRLTCTTAVSGSFLGPLRALPCNPDQQDSCRRNVGAEQIFWTIIP